MYRVPGKNSYTICATLQVAMCNPAALKHMQTLTGGAGALSEQGRKQNKKRGWNPLWHWVLACQAAAKVLRQILPYLIVRRPQAELLIELATLRATRGPGHPKVNPKRQETILLACQRLNKRGTNPSKRKYPKP